MTTEEEQLLKALRGLGSAMAIGRPGEKLPQIGAARVYYDDNEWRDRVEKLIRSARLLVIRTGIGEGLRWEVEHVIRWYTRSGWSWLSPTKRHFAHF